MIRKCVPVLLTLTALLLLGCAHVDNEDTPGDKPTISFVTVPTAEQVESFPDNVTELTSSVTEETSTIPVSVSTSESFVEVVDYIPTIILDLRYSTPNNFTGQKIYDFRAAFLRRGTVEKLAKVASDLEQYGVYLKIWDAFRPVAAQFKLWEIYPDANFVANPNVGYSSHSRGNTFDVTLVDKYGNELEMPSGFDDFSALADRDYSDCTETAAQNALLLQNTMVKHGFTGYSKEWWHFSDTVKYNVEECFDPSLISRWYANCNEFISLRTAPSTSASVITKILVNEEFTLLGRTGEFAFVDYNGQQGYVLASYIRPVQETENELTTKWIANCDEYISLRATPGGSEVITRIPAGGTVTLKKWCGKYALVDYGSQNGYVLTSYIKPQDIEFFEKYLSTVILTGKYTYTQMQNDLDLLAASFPDVVTISSIGVSELGRNIPVLQLGSIDSKHHVLLQGAIHGREHMTAWLLMALADYYLNHDVQNYGDVCFHIIPMTNPDGVVISQNQSLDSFQRSIYELDKAKGYTSATLSNYAMLWKANGVGVDLNRNFPSGWDSVDGRGEVSSQQFKGDNPFSAAETCALRDYTMRYNFDATVSFHAAGSAIYYKYGKKLPVNELSYSLATEVAKITGYSLEGSSAADGAGYKDWAIDELLIPSLTIEIGCGDAPLAEQEIYSILARSSRIFPVIAQWTRSNAFDNSITGDSDRANTMEVEFFPGGKQETMLLALHIGQGYSLYMPCEGWVLTQETYGDNTPAFEDNWKSTLNDDAYLKVAYYPSKSLDEVRGLVTAREGKYSLQVDKQGGLGGMNKEGTQNLEVRLYETAEGILTVTYHYPMKYAETLGSKLSVLADTFVVSK